MARPSKRLEAMRANPAGDWRISDVEAVCREHGLYCQPPKKGSHYKIGHPKLRAKVVLPSRRPIKEVYARQLIELVDAASEAT